MWSNNLNTPRYLYNSFIFISITITLCYVDPVFKEKIVRTIEGTSNGLEFAPNPCLMM